MTQTVKIYEGGLGNVLLGTGIPTNGNATIASYTSTAGDYGHFAKGPHAGPSQGLCLWPDGIVRAL
jgi:hypothetical protein